VQNVIGRLSTAQGALTSYDVTMSVSGPETMEMTGAADLAGGKRNVAMALTNPDLGEMEVRLVDGVLYLRLAMLTGDTFLQLDPNDASNELASAFAGMGDSIVESGFEGTEEAVVSVTPIGSPETLDGVEVQAYELVMDTTKFSTDAANELLEDGMAMLPPTITYTYWLDADDIPRKTVYEVAGTTTTLIITNIGSGAPVTAPAPEQITTDMPF